MPPTMVSLSNRRWPDRALDIYPPQSFNGPQCPGGRRTGPPADTLTSVNRRYHRMQDVSATAACGGSPGSETRRTQKVNFALETPSTDRPASFHYAGAPAAFDPHNRTSMRTG